MKMSLVILLPLGKVTGNQLLSLSLIFCFPPTPPLENITVHCIHLQNEKCNYFAKDSGVGFAAAFPPIWEAHSEVNYNSFASVVEPEFLVLAKG